MICIGRDAHRSASEGQLAALVQPLGNAEAASASHI